MKTDFFKKIYNDNYFNNAFCYLLEHLRRRQGS